MSSSRARAMGLGGLVVFIAGFWWLRIVVPSSEPTRVVSDLQTYYYPLFQITGEWIASGRLPLWNPHHLTGLPWLATPQTGALYPPHLLYVFLPTPTALALSGLLHLVGMALGTAWLLHRLGARPALCAMGGALGVLWRPTLDWLFFPSALETAAWLPIGCVGVLAISRGEAQRGTFWLALATGMSLLAGFPQLTVLSGYTWGLLLLACLIGEPAARRQPVRATAIAAGAVILGSLLGAAQVLPSAEFTLEGTRAAEQVPEILLRDPGGSSYFALPEIARAAPRTLGLLVLVLAPAALFQPRLPVIAWALGLAALSHGLASSLGIFEELYRTLPVVGWFPVPRRWLVVTHFCLAVAAALGAEALATRLGRAAATRSTTGLRELLTALPSAGVALAVAAFLLGSAQEDDVALGGLGLAVAVLFLVAPWLGWRGVGGPVAPRLLVAGLLLAAAVDLWLSALPVGRLPYEVDAASSYERHGELFHTLGDELGGDRLASLFFRPNREIKLAPRYDLHWLDGFEPLTLRRQSEYFGFLRDGTTSPHATSRFAFTGRILPGNRSALLTHKTLPVETWPVSEVLKRRRLLDLAAMRFLITGAPVARLPEAMALFASSGLEARPLDDARYVLLENTRVLPRAFVTYRALPAPDVETLLSRMAQEDFDPLRASYVEGDPGFHASPAAPARGSAAKLVLDDATRVEVDAQLIAPGLVVLADAFAAGWEVRVDEEPARLLAANHLFRAVVAPAGRHRIVFDYRPRGVRWGFGLALVAVLGMTGLAVGIWRAARR